MADELDFMTNRVQKVELEVGSKAITSTPLFGFQATENLTFFYFYKLPTSPLVHTLWGDVMGNICVLMQE